MGFGFVPSQADSIIFKAIGTAPDAKFNHVLRWYQHIQSFGSDVASFPGVPKAADAYGSVCKCQASKGGKGDDGASAAAKKEEEEDDDDVDLFGSDDEDDKEAQEKLKQERVAAYAAKKSTKPGLIAKSMIILDVKPWDDETDIAEIEKSVRSIEAAGLKWGASKFLPIAYGLKKLQISCVVEDDKIGTDFLEEKITAFEDLVQSIDVAAFNKL